MRETNDGGPAFPCEHTNEALQDELVKARVGGASLSFSDIRKLSSFHPGMTLRDWFAGQALSAMAVQIAVSEPAALTMARSAYVVADAMVAERAKDRT